MCTTEYKSFLIMELCEKWAQSLGRMKTERKPRGAYILELDEAGADLERRLVELRNLLIYTQPFITSQAEAEKIAGLSAERLLELAASCINAAAICYLLRTAEQEDKRDAVN